MNPANIIKTRRKLMGMSQVELANSSGISQALICKLENGKLQPRFDVMLRILKALKVNVKIEFRE